MPQLRFARAVIALFAALVILAACASDKPLAEFDVVALDPTEPTTDQPASAQSAAEPDPSAGDLPTDPPDAVDEPSATEPSATEPSATEPSATEPSGEQPQAEEATTNLPNTVAVDRGDPIPVIDGAGTRFDRVDGELAAGETLTYEFEVTSGQSVLIRQLGGCAFFGERVLMGALSGVRGFGGGIFFNVSGGDCTEAIRRDAEESGVVRMTFSSPNPEFSGSFSFDIVDVTDEATVRLTPGDLVEPDVPTQGAGVIELPGTFDRYSFEALPGGAYLLRGLGCQLTNTDLLSIEFDGVARGSAFLHASDGCSAVDRFETTVGGTVFFTVDAGADHEGFGTYSFELVNLNATDTFELQLGETVSPGTPGPGAGHIEQPGGRDRYTLDLAAGQTVAISQQGGCEFDGGTFLAMSVDGAGINRTFGFQSANGDDDCFDVARLTAEFNGTVTMEIKESSNEVTGTYSFAVTAGAETIDEAEEVLDGLAATEVDEEQLITLDETLLFDFASAALRPNANQALADVADVLGVYAVGEVRVVGHTDAIGSESDNRVLSQRRADAVAEALINLGVDRSRLSASGVGESSPLEPNENADGSDNPEGRAANRRVEVFFTTSG